MDTVVDAEAVPEVDDVGRTGFVRDSVPLIVMLAEAVPPSEIVPVEECVSVASSVTVVVPSSENDGVGVCVGVRVRVGGLVKDSDPVSSSVSVAVVVMVMRCDNVAVSGLSDNDPENVLLPLSVASTVIVGPEIDWDAVVESEALTVRVSVGRSVLVRVSGDVSVALEDGESEPVSVIVSTVPVGCDVSEPDSERVNVPNDFVSVPSSVTDGDGATVAESVRSSEALMVAEPVIDGESLARWVRVIVGKSVAVSVPDIVSVRVSETAKVRVSDAGESETLPVNDVEADSVSVELPTVAVSSQVVDALSETVSVGPLFVAVGSSEEEMDMVSVSVTPNVFVCVTRAVSDSVCEPDVVPSSVGEIVSESVIVTGCDAEPVVESVSPLIVSVELGDSVMSCVGNVADSDDDNCCVPLYEAPEWLSDAERVPVRSSDMVRLKVSESLMMCVSVGLRVMLSSSDCDSESLSEIESETDDVSSKLRDSEDDTDGERLPDAVSSTVADPDVVAVPEISIERDPVAEPSLMEALEDAVP